jgi:hypothetical protein
MHLLFVFIIHIWPRLVLPLTAVEYNKKVLTANERYTPHYCTQWYPNTEAIPYPLRVFFINFISEQFCLSIIYLIFSYL